MAFATPSAGSALNSPSHSLLHRQFDIDTAASAQSMVIDGDGKVGIGTASPAGNLNVQGAAATDGVIRIDAVTGQNPILALRYNSAGGNNDQYFLQYDNAAAGFALRSSDVDGAGADGDVFTIADGTDEVIFNGNVGIGTDSPTGILTISNNNWIAARNAADSAGINMFKVNASDTIDVGAALNVGTIALTEDSGDVTLVNLPVSGAAADGTSESYSFAIDSEAILQVKALSDGTGGIDTKSVVINGDLGLTGTRITKGWFTDLQVTNAIAGSVTGNAATVSTITGLAPDTQNTYARTQYLIPYASSTTAFGEIAIGTAAQVLTSNGAGAAPTFQDAAAGGGGTEWIEFQSYTFESTTRYATSATAGTPTATFNENGLALITGGSEVISKISNFYTSLTTASDKIMLQISGTTNGGVDSGDEGYIGVGLIASAVGGHTFTNDHFGFKFIGDGTAIDISATNASGGTETSTIILENASSSTRFTLRAVFDGGTDIKFFSGASDTALATHTTNLPTIATFDKVQFSIGQNNNMICNNIKMFYSPA